MASGVAQREVNIADWVTQVRQSAKEGVVNRDYWQTVIKNIRGPLADRLNVHQCAVLLHALTTAGCAEFEAMTLLNGRILSELEGAAIQDNLTKETEEAREEVTLRSSCISVSDCRLIVRASGQSRMYDSQVLELVAGILVSRLSELNAAQLISVLESYARLPRMRSSRESDGATEDPTEDGDQQTVNNVQLLFEVAAAVLPESLPHLESFQLCTVAQAYSKLGFFAPPLLKALADELSMRLNDSEVFGSASSKRKAVTPIEAHRFIVALATVVDIDKASPELRESLERCVDRLIKTCLFYTTTQLNSRGCLQLMAALKRLGNYDEKFINTRLLPTLNQHYMKGRSVGNSDDGMTARVHEGVLILECLAAIPQATAMLARLRETIIYDTIEWVASTDPPYTDRSARDFLSIIARLMLCIPEGEQSAAYEMWEAARSKIGRAIERGLSLSDSHLKRLLRICEKVDDRELADAISRSLAGADRDR